MSRNISLRNAEEQIINHLIADNSLYWQYCPRLKNDFFVLYQNIWAAYKQIISNGDYVNLITLTKILGENYFETLTILTTKIKYDIDFETWINYLNDETKRNKGIKLLSRLNDIIINNEIDKIELAIQDAINDLSGENFEHKDMIEHVKEMIGYIEKIKTGQRITGFPTGINRFDNFTGGLQPTDLTIIAGETSQGKTTFTLNIAYANAIAGNYVGIFSLEMSLRQLTARLLAIDTNISSKEILSGRVDFQTLNEKLGKVINNKILLDNTRNSSLENIISKMRYFIARFGCKLFFIDYLQLITFHKKGNSTEQNLADICRTFKNFAKENDCSIVLLCQLNRNNQATSEPRLSRLRGSGQIEETADNVIFVSRPMPNKFSEPEQAKLYLSKGRNCGTGDFDLIFYGEIPTFQNT